MDKLEFERWLLEELRQVKIKLSETRSEYYEGYSVALRHVLDKLKEE